MMYLNTMLKFSKKRFTVKEHITMSENLGDAISQLLMNDTKKVVFNTRVRVELAKTAALVKPYIPSVALSPVFIIGSVPLELLVN